MTERPDERSPDRGARVDPEDIEIVEETPERRTEQRRAPAPRITNRVAVPVILFAATCVSTFLVGVCDLGPPFILLLAPAEVLAPLGELGLQAGLWSLFVKGVSFAGPLMAILFSHEMGHYLQARRHGVPATLPYFIPMPISPFGTLGAVILQGTGVADRKQLYDIAITGPLAGLVIALPVAWFGLLDAEIRTVPPDQQNVIIYGDPLILQWMIEWMHRPLGPHEQVTLNSWLFAGWVGIFVTALNLIPIGQLDGGHILYSLVGRRAHGVALALLWGAVGYMIYTGNYSYVLIVILLMIFGPRHPPTADDRVPLGPGRIALGWLTLAFIVIGFTPRPIVTESMRSEKPPPEQKQEEPETGPAFDFETVQFEIAEGAEVRRGGFCRLTDRSFVTFSGRATPDAPHFGIKRMHCPSGTS